MDLEHEKRLAETESRSKSNSRRLEKVEKKQEDLSELVGTVKVLVEREENVENDVKEIKTDVKMLTNKPAKMWESVLEKVLLTLVAAVVGFILAKFGL